MHTPSEIQYSTVIACAYDRYIFNIIILICSYQIYSDYVYYCILRNSCQMHFESQNFEHHHNKATGWNTLEHIHTHTSTDCAPASERHPAGKSRVSWNLGNKMLKRLVRIISTTCGGYNYLDRKLPIWSQWGQRNHVWWQVSIPALWPGLNNSKNAPKHHMSEPFLVWCSDHCCTFLPQSLSPNGGWSISYIPIIHNAGDNSFT